MKPRAVCVTLLLMLVTAALPPAARAEQASQPSSPHAGQLDAGGSHTCAVTDGKVHCWGLGFSGQLGYGNTANVGDNEAPGRVGSVYLGPGRTATAVSAGDFHTCALLDDGSVRCWGFGEDGRLGYGNETTIGDNELPGSISPVNLGGPATAISAGASHTCAVLVGGSVRCWGYGSDGRLGYATEDPLTFESETVGDNETPASVAPLDLGAPATAISVGAEHSCAILVGGAVRCWGDPGGFTGGDGGDGRLGYANANFIGDDEAPSSRALSAVACPPAGTLCTAVDNAGQQVTFNPAAPGTPTPSMIDNRTLTAVACPSPTQCTAVGAGQQVTFNPAAPGTPPATTIDNRVLSAVACPSLTQCTAVDDLGRAITFNPNAPGTPTPTTIDNGRALTAIACASETQCTAVGSAGQQVTFNPAAPGTPTPTTIDNGRALTAVACPSDTQCTAVGSAGQQVTFNPKAPGTPTPTAIDSGRALTAIACPSPTQCTAVGRAGQQVTFNPAAPGSPTPTTIDTGRLLSAVACQSTTQCTAVGRAGQQVTFSPVAPGLPARTTIDAAPPVNIGGNATAISAGDWHTCAVLAGGSVRCWGLQNPGGRLGYPQIGVQRGVGDNEPPASVGPVELGAGRTATAITVGNHTCALLDNGNVRCWGPGAAGRLGYGNTSDIGDNESPASVGPVDLGRAATAVSAGSFHTCARLDNTSLRCWGEGQYGRLGYANERDIGDDETTAALGPVDLKAGVSVGDASVVEGNSGERTLTFAVKTSVAVEDAASVSYATANAGAQAAGDYTPRSGVLTFAPGEASKTITVRIKGDTTDEPNERFRVNLSNATNLTVTRNGTGTIVDDDAPAAPGGSTPTDSDAAAQRAEAARARGLRACNRRAARHARTDLRRARRLKGSRRSAAKRHARRHRASLQRACKRRWGRTPGRVADLKARAASAGEVVLSFTAVGTDGTRPPAARGYVLKQSRRPIRTARAFRRAQTLCGGTCRFSSVKRVGEPLSLRVRDVRGGTQYYYAIAARDNVSRRVGSRSPSVGVKTK